MKLGGTVPWYTEVYGRAQLWKDASDKRFLLRDKEEVRRRNERHEAGNAHAEAAQRALTYDAMVSYAKARTRKGKAGRKTRRKHRLGFMQQSAFT